MKPPFRIPLARPCLPPRTLDLIRGVISDGRLGGAGRHTAWCEAFLERATGAPRVLLTNSACSALDAAAQLVGLKPGDEVILPSFAFPSPANAVARLGGIPVFVDIEGERLGLDTDRAAAAITPRTRAIIVIHYAGMPADLDGLSRLCAAHGLALIEDSAQAFDSSVDGRMLGTFGSLGVFSFQQTKNIATGEGGALVVNDPALVERAQHLRDKGTNRHEMEAGIVPFYEWVEIGSGIAPSELTAAVLRAQLEVAADIKATRRRLFNLYRDGLAHLEAAGTVQIPCVDPGWDHNAHCFYLLLPDRAVRDRLLARLNADGIGAATHFVPLHLSAAGRRVGRCPMPCPVTEDIARRLLRLPLYVGLTDSDVEMICAATESEIGRPRLLSPRQRTEPADRPGRADS